MMQDPINMQPRANVGQTKVGSGYTVLIGGQDVRDAGWYFNENTHELAWYRAGDRVGGPGDHWQFLGDDEAADRETLVQRIRERGWGGDPSVIHLVH